MFMLSYTELQRKENQKEPFQSILNVPMQTLTGFIHGFVVVTVNTFCFCHIILDSESPNY